MSLKKLFLICVCILSTVFFVSPTYAINEQIKVVSYNIQSGCSAPMDEGTFNLVQTIDYLKSLNADVILLQEVGYNKKGICKGTGNDMTNDIATALNMNQYAYGSLSLITKHIIEDKKGGKYSDQHPGSARKYMRVKLKTASGNRFVVINTHLERGYSGDHAAGIQIRKKQILELKNIVNQELSQKNPTILGGDFNECDKSLISNTFSNFFNPISGNTFTPEKPTNPDTIKKLALSSSCNSATANDANPTINEQIDYLLADKSYWTVTNSNVLTNAGSKSDHYPIQATFSLDTAVATSGSTSTVITAKTGVPLVDEIKLTIEKPQPKITIPGLNFSEVDLEAMVTEEGGSTWLNIPFLGEYLATIYKYGIIVITIIGVLGLIAGGVMWIMSGGTADGKTRAIKYIKNSIIGILLAVTSYTLLYMINPNLVEFQNLKILWVQGDPNFVNNESVQDYSGITNVEKAKVIKLVGDLAEKAGVPRCIAETLVKFESGGTPNVIGHDENFAIKSDRLIGSRIEFLNSGKMYSDKPFTPGPKYSEVKTKLKNLSGDERKDYLYSVYQGPKNDDIGYKVNPSTLKPPDYGIDWRFTHGFGIGQITCGGNIKPCMKNGGKGCMTGGKCFTVPELLTLEGGLEAKIASLVKRYQMSCWGVPAGVLGTPQEQVPDNVIKKTIASWGTFLGCKTSKTIPWADTREKRFQTYKACIANGGTLIK